MMKTTSSLDRVDLVTIAPMVEGVLIDHHLGFQTHFLDLEEVSEMDLEDLDSVVSKPFRLREVGNQRARSSLY